MPASRKYSHNSTNPAEESKSKRVVVRATQVQIHELKTAFEESYRPTTEAKEALARRLGLTSTWVNNWFMRERKKVEFEFKTNFHVDSATAASPNPSIVSDSSAMTAATSRAASRVPSLTNVTDWSDFYSTTSSAPSSSTSARLATAPSLSDKNYMNQSYSLLSPSSYHAQQLTYPSQSFISDASSMPTYSTDTAIPRSLSQPQPHSQFAPRAPHPSLGYAAYYPRFAINPSLEFGAGTPQTSTWLRSGQDAELTMDEKNAENGSTSERACVNVKAESASASTAQGEGIDAGAFDSETEDEVTPYLGPIAVPYASEHQVLKGEAPKVEAEELESPLTEAEAWQRVQHHPQFAMLLEIAGVRGPFRLTEDGLIIERA